MSDASDTLWDQYVDDYHDFWDYVEEHEEILQKGSNVTLVRDIMEECPVVNFSCVRDLIYTMRQFLGEKRFREKEGQCKALLKSKIRECITSFNSAEEEESEEESEVEVNSNNFLRKRLTTHVQKKFRKKAYHLLEKKQDCLRELPVKRYYSQVYGQAVFRQQALILNFNILRTFCDNLLRYYPVKPSDCGKILRRLAREAFDPEAMCIQAADCYIPTATQSTMQTLTQMSIWPLHEPVVSSYDDRKAVLSRRWEAAERPKSIMPPIYTPRVHSRDVVGFRKTTKLKDKQTHTRKVEFDSIPRKIADSRHFKRVMKIVHSRKYARKLNHNERDPTRKSYWLYYCVVVDPTVSPEAADQGYIGMTTRDLNTGWKEHVKLKGKLVVEYNLALVSEYARQRGEDISEYVAVFVLGTTTNEKALKKIKRKLIRETTKGFGVGNMKYGMNDKRAAQTK